MTAKNLTPRHPRHTYVCRDLCDVGLVLTWYSGQRRTHRKACCLCVTLTWSCGYGSLGGWKDLSWASVEQGPGPAAHRGDPQWAEARVTRAGSQDREGPEAPALGRMVHTIRMAPTCEVTPVNTRDCTDCCPGAPISSEASTPSLPQHTLAALLTGCSWGRGCGHPVARQC